MCIRDSLVFRLVPSGDDVEADPAFGDLVDGGDLLGDDRRVIGRDMDGGKDIEVLGLSLIHI